MYKNFPIQIIEITQLYFLSEGNKNMIQIILSG